MFYLSIESINPFLLRHKLAYQSTPSIFTAYLKAKPSNCLNPKHMDQVAYFLLLLSQQGNFHCAT